MVIVVMIIMALVIVSYVLKMTCHGWLGRLATCAVASLFVILACDAAAGQSKARIADWLSQPELMLDMSVWLTVDVAFQVAFCVLAADSIAGPLSRSRIVMLEVCRWFPGVLVFPVLFAMLTELIFSLPGADFATIAWGLSLGLFVGVPLLVAGLLWLLPEKEIRLELLFMVNMLIAALGVVATINGRTAAAGTNEADWGALAAVVAILAVGTVIGIVLNKYLTRKHISKIK
ncbi:MAG: hypothetical protein NC113_06580 [Bacteroides sp.]|nr:hypothetical protein [Bacteroides sp.]MCM1447871.1 hypothetical protein [Bacteroides sp.]MCM1515646.1 hypothetical protein [Paraprevotella sp.]